MLRDIPAAGERCRRPIWEHPDWIYVLRESYDLYRRSSAGGSVKIRSHQRSVRERINRVIKSDAEVRFSESMSKPVVQHLRRALDNGKVERHASMRRAR